MATRYTESVLCCESKPRIADGVIHGVKILGENSVNKRRYSKAVREAAKDKYEGAKVNIDHPKKGESVERSFRDWVGVLENVQVRRDGTFGDLRLRQEHNEFKAIIEAAEKFWCDFGLSHVANCESRNVGGVDEVTEIVEVFSVDIVGDPATTNGLMESRNRDMAKGKKTVKQVAESLPETHPARKIMLEACAHKTVMEMMGGDYDMGSLGIEEPAAAAGGGVSDQLASEAMAALTETNKALLAVLSKAKPAAPGGAPPTNNPPGNQEIPPVATDPNKPAADPEADKEKDKFAAMESKLARMEVKTLLLESDREANEVWIEAAANIDDSAKRKAFVESLPKRNGNTRESRGSRPDISPPATTSEGRKQRTPEEIYESRREKNKQLRESRQAAVR